MRHALIPLAALALLALPGFAQAADQSAAEEEYILDIPGAGGDQPTTPSGASPSAGGELPPGTEDALLGQGADGAKAAKLARETDPGSGRGGDGRPDDAAAGGDEGGAGIGDVVADLASGSDSGMGLFLPIVLIVALGGALALVAWRRRSGSTHA